MKLEIITQTEQKLLSRIDITAKISYDKQTSSTQEIVKELSKQVSKPAENIQVRTIKPAVGAKEAVIKAYAYENKDLIDRLTKKGKKELEKIKKAEEEKKKAEEEKKKAAEEAKKAEQEAKKAEKEAKAPKEGE